MSTSFERRVIKSAIKLGFNVKPQPSQLDREPNLSRRAYMNKIRDVFQALKEVDRGMQPIVSGSHASDIDAYGRDIENLESAWGNASRAYAKIAVNPILNKYKNGWSRYVPTRLMLKRAYKQAKAVADSGGDTQHAAYSLMRSANNVKNILSEVKVELADLQRKIKGE